MNPYKTTALPHDFEEAVVFYFSSACFQFLYHEKVPLREGVIKFHPYHHFSEYFLYFADILRRRREIERKSEKKNVFT